MNARANEVVQRKDAATAAEEQAVRVAIVRRSRPIAAEVADIAQTAIVAVAKTRSRIPDGRSRTELAEEGRELRRHLVWLM